MIAIVNNTGLKIDFSRNEIELWLDEGEERLALTGSAALIAIAAVRQVLGSCQRRIANGGFAFLYIGNKKLVNPGRIAQFLATQNLSQDGLYNYLTAA